MSGKGGDASSIMEKTLTDADANGSNTDANGENDAGSVNIVKSVNATGNTKNTDATTNTAQISNLTDPTGHHGGERKSQRSNLGIPPARYGNPTTGQRGGRSKSRRGNRKSVADFEAHGADQQREIAVHNEENPEEARRSPKQRNSAGGAGCSASSRRSGKSSRSNASSIARKRLELELKQAQELDRLEEEADRRRLERKKEMFSLQAKLRLAELEEEGDSCDDISSDSIQTQHSKVRAWNVYDPIGEASGMQRRTRDAVEQSRGPQQPQPKEPDATRLEKMMARHAINKDLPIFSGDIAEWPLFFQSFKNTTEVCGFNNSENMARLQKCLKGKAANSVQALLMTDKVDQVINILERRYGRPEHIIKHLMSKVASSLEIKEHQPQLFIEFVDTVTNFVATVEALGRPEYLNNPMFMDQLVSKLPLSRKLQWATFVQGGRESMDLKRFTSWLEDQAAIAILVCDPIAVKSGKPLIGTVGEPSSKSACAYCEAEHPVSQCEKLKALSVSDRWKWVKEKKLCFCCLKSRHSSKDCKRRRCGKNGCSKRHHPVLHSDDTKEESSLKTGPQPPLKTNSEEVVTINVIHRRKRHVFLKVVPVTLTGPAGEVETYAFLDDGSQMSLIQESLAEELGLEGEIAPFKAQWYNNSTTEDPTSRRVTLKIRGTTGEEFHLRDVRTQRSLNLARESKRVDTDTWTYLKDLPLPDVMYAEPRIMIGQDFGSLITPRRTVFGKGNAPMASLTPLGWTVHGPCNMESGESEYVMHCYQPEWDELKKSMQNFWSVEAFGVSSTAARLRSKEDQRAEEVLNRTTQRRGNRWETGLLWRTDNDTLPPSWNLAEKRFRSLEKKMEREPAVKIEYHKKIQDYEDKGYARRLTSEEAAREGPRTWYLPHFVVFNSNKPGKMRIVFDAAAKSHGVSLNDRLLKGPDLLCSLVGVLYRFRERAIAVCGDLREMFHQVKIRAEDQSSQRILGRDPKTGKIIIFEMQVMIFGAVSSPYVAQEIRNRNAKEFQEAYPEAYRVITENHYMDDYLDSVDTIPEAIQRASDVAHVHWKGGFEVRNWMSNSKEVLATLPQDAIAHSGSKLALDTEEFQRVLGVIWSPDSDHFTFTSVFPKVDKRIVDGEKLPTKREVLKVVMSVFDPLGLLSVMTIRAKILMQDIWRSGLGWDQSLPENLTSKWQTWLEDLRSVTELRIPRFYALGIGQVKDIQLHVFCDASQQAFAAAAYLRLEGESGIRATLVTSKSRVAPLKTMTIPRLELQAAVMGTRLATVVTTEHSLQLSRKIFWTDSETVMKWIHSESRRYPSIFEANRVAEILDTTGVNDWRWIPTKENVADEATRDTEHLEIKSSSRWFTGPEFLIKTEANWPQGKWQAPETEAEFCLLIQDKLKLKDLVDVYRFSSWMRMVRALTWTKFLAKKWRTRQRAPKSEVKRLLLPVALVLEVENEILKMVQMESFPADAQRLREMKGISRESRLFELSPILGEDGLIRMDGRIREGSGVGLAARQPIILDGKHPAVRLLIHTLHVSVGHHGRERVLNDLRQQFWIIKARAAVKAVWNACQHCRNQRAKPYIPPMAQLTPARTEGFVAPFTNTGVDYFGPFQITIGRRKEKRYGVLFTCMAVRAVHLEIAHSLSTDSMIMALRRMMARRGKPKRILSDNGTNSVGARRILAEAWAELDQDDLQQRAAAARIEWKFIPPGSPHMGGAWERLVRSVKTALEAIMKEQAPREEILQTIFAEAEYSVNCRPLTYVSDDPTVPESLTPMHFLRVSPTTTDKHHGAPGIFRKGDCVMRRQWRMCQYFADQFWQRWVKEYLPTLNRRTKWHQGRGDLKIGDLVIIGDHKSPRNQWTRGRVTEVFPGTDGRVRVAEVATATGTYRRPAAKLRVLDVL